MDGSSTYIFHTIILSTPCVILNALPASLKLDNWIFLFKVFFQSWHDNAFGGVQYKVTFCDQEVVGPFLRIRDFHVSQWNRGSSLNLAPFRY